jgi:hypothetical protein
MCIIFLIQRCIADKGVKGKMPFFIIELKMRGINEKQVRKEWF